MQLSLKLHNQYKKAIFHAFLIENMLNIFRAIILPLILLCLFNSIFTILEKWGLSLILLAFMQIFALIYIFILQIINLKNLKIVSRETLKAKNIFYSPTEDKLSFGDKDLWEIGLNASEFKQSYKVKIDKKDKMHFLISLCALTMFFGFGAKNNIIPDFAVFFGGAPQNISAFIKSPEYAGAQNFEAEDNVDTPANSIIEIQSIGSKYRPKIKYNGKVYFMAKDSVGNYKINIMLKQSGTIKLIYFGMRKSWKINIKKDNPPKFNAPTNIEIISQDELLLTININDDFGLKNANLILQGNVDNLGQTHKAQSIIPINMNDLQINQQSKIKINVAKSLLVNENVKAWVEVFDGANNYAKSNIRLIKLINPAINSDLGNALQEIRLLILRENNNYKAQFNNFYKVPNAINGENLIDISSPIDNAPKAIKRAYDYIKALDNAQILEISDKDKAGIKYIKSTLESAKTLAQAQEVVPILWDLIERNRNLNQDTKSNIAQAINNLKQAIENNADKETISKLKDELGQAINNHLQSLAQNNNEIGDMEIEDNQNIGGQDIDKMLQDIEEAAKNNYGKDALDKLNALAELMESLSVDSNNGQEGASNSENKDPLGREPEVKKGESEKISKDSQNALPQKQDNQTIYDIVKKLREKISNSQDNAEEEKYLNDLLSRSSQ